MSLAQMRQGLKARLETIAGLNVHDYAPAAVTAPAAIIIPREGSYGAKGAKQLHTMVVQILVSLGRWNEAQKELDQYIDRSGAKSIETALETSVAGDQGLKMVRVAHYEAYGIKEYPPGSDKLYMGVDFVVEVEEP